MQQNKSNGSYNIIMYKVCCLPWHLVGCTRSGRGSLHSEVDNLHRNNPIGEGVDALYVSC